MLDPFPFEAPAALQAWIAPLANRLGLTTLPLHFHEVIFSVIVYQFIFEGLSPALSTWLCPQTYPQLNRRTRINWNVHVVSQFQAIFICGLAFYIIFFDEERANMSWAGRIWGYTGAGGFLQAMAEGYFIWDLIVTAWHVKIFGLGMLAHAVAATTVFSLGFRPFVNYYGPIFILYELSSPLNNQHWFLDKLHLTGSTYQWVNGIALIVTFFTCRLVWGAVGTVWVFSDIWQAMRHGRLLGENDAGLRFGLVQDAGAAGHASTYPSEEIMRFAGDTTVPLWLALSYLFSNIVLNMLNYYWMGKMIETIRKRFPPPFGTKGTEKVEEPEKHSTEKPQVEVQRGLYQDGRKTVEIEGREVRSRRRG